MSRDPAFLSKLKELRTVVIDREVHSFRFTGQVGWEGEGHLQMQF